MKSFKIFIIILLFPLFIFSQSETGSGLSIIAKGTGNTTGNIAKLIINNNTKEPIMFKLDGYIIPSDGKHQGYIIPMPDDPNIMVNPGITTVSLNGYCSDIRKPPVNSDIDMVEFNDWVKYSELTTSINPNTDLEDSGFHPIKYGGDISLPNNTNSDGSNVLETTYLGTDIPFKYTIDLTKYVEAAAPLLFESIDRITTTYGDLVGDGLISTPYSENLEKEKEVVIQQTFWIYTSILTGDPYTLKDFTQKLEEQFTNTTGQDIENVDTIAQQQFQSGIDQFWSTFELVGVKAKVMKPSDGIGGNDGNFQDGSLLSGDGNSSSSNTPEDPCGCSSCIVKTSLKIVNKRTGNEIITSTIPWCVEYLSIYPPVVVSDCPGDCNSGNNVTIEVVVNEPNASDLSKRTRMLRGSGDSKSPLEVKLFGPGEIKIIASYSCSCDGGLCGDGTIIKKITIAESNDCCDKLRSQNSGDMKLRFGTHKSIIIDQNNLTLQLENKAETFTFPNNIEAIFCNQSDGDIFSVTGSTCEQRIIGNSIVGTSVNGSSLNISRPDASDLEAEGNNPHYTFRFMLNDHGEETSVSFSMDMATCLCLIQIAIDDEITEDITGKFDYDDFVEDIEGMDDFPRNNQWWQRLAFLYRRVGNVETSYFALLKLRSKTLKAIVKLLNDGSLSSRQRALLRELFLAVGNNEVERINQLLASNNFPTL